MGAAGSVGVDPSVLRKEYEDMVAKNVGDEELLRHMKELILSAPADDPDKRAGQDVGTRRLSVQRKSAAASESEKKVAAVGSQARRGSAAANARNSVEGGAASSVGRRGSASRPNSHNSRLSYSASTKASQERRGSNARRTSVDGDRPLSAPQTKPAVPKQRPRSSVGERNDGNDKPTKSRRRSFLGKPVSQPLLMLTTGAAADDAVGVAAELAVAAVTENDAVPAQDAETMQIDSWESVSQQPSCPLCHMVFSTEGKRDQHIKYSPAHAPPKEGEESPPEPVMDSVTIYSGTKLFWRTRLNVELFMQQHKIANAVQVLVFDAKTNRELGQVWISWNNVVAKIDAKEMKKEMEAADRAFHNLGMKPTPENVEAEATRKAAVSFIIKRLQARTIHTTILSGAPKSYQVSLMQMAADDVMDLLVEVPDGVNPTFSRALMKRASIQEVNEVMTSLRKNLGDVSTAAKVAVASLEGATGAVEQGRRGSVEVARRASIQGS
ncbi:unnamed protein product [Scytosiphon promiscuus]